MNETTNTDDYQAHVSRRNANAERITHEVFCQYPGEVTDDGTRCTCCHAGAAEQPLTAGPAAEPGELEPSGLPPQLAALVQGAQAFSRGVAHIDHRAVEVEAEELDRAELAEVVAILDGVRDDLHAALQRLAPAVRLQNGPSAATLSMSEALHALSVAGAGVQLRHVAHDLDPTRSGGEQ